MEPTSGHVTDLDRGQVRWSGPGDGSGQVTGPVRGQVRWSGQVGGRVRQVVRIISEVSNFLGARLLLQNSFIDR